MSSSTEPSAAQGAAAAGDGSSSQRSSAPCKKCGKTPTQVCSRCKLVHYCGRECQVADWKAHKPDCKRNDGACCDECKILDTDITNCCFACGYLFCDECGEKYIVRNSNSKIVSFHPCPGCGNEESLDFGKRENWKKLNKLFHDKPQDPRRAKWMSYLAGLYRDAGFPFSKVKECYEQAGKLGFGEGYSRLAEEYAKRGEWDQTRLYYEKAAALSHVGALHCLAVEASQGYFDFGYMKQEHNHHPPDKERAFRHMKLAAALDYPPSCSALGKFYEDGVGVNVNMDKAYKWYRKGAEKGDPMGMKMLGIAYNLGDYLEQNHELARFWFQKAADLGDAGAQRLLANMGPNDGRRS